MKRIINIMTALLISASAVTAQNIWSFQYNMALPHGDTKEYTDNASFRGITMDSKTFVSDNIALGGFISWNVFKGDVDDGHVNFNGNDIFGHEYRYINAVPVMATASYFPTMKEGSILKPYATLGIGTIFQEDLVEIGTNAYYNDGWMFGMAPELGLNIIINEKMDFMASYKYVIGFQTSQVSQLSYSNLNLGLAFKF